MPAGYPRPWNLLKMNFLRKVENRYFYGFQNMIVLLNSDLFSEKEKLSA